MWPSLPVANHIADMANVFFIGSLVVGVVSTILIVWMSGVKETYWEKDRTESAERVAGLMLQGDQLRKDTAEANKVAAQARLELQKLQAWRMVDSAKFNAKLVGVETPTNVEILYVPECSDCFMVAGMVAALLKDKNWPYSLSELKKLQSPPDWMSGFPATMQHRANPTGVSVLSKTSGNLQEMSPARALMIAIGYSLDTGGFIAADETMPEGVVRIVIAPKI